MALVHVDKGVHPSLPTVTGQHKELFFAINGMRGDFGIGSNDLLLGRQGKVLLELKVTNRTRQSQVA